MVDANDFDLQRLFLTVFEPRRGERVAVLADLPHDGIVDNDEWSARREMAREWQREIAQFGRRLGLFVHPIAYYQATGQHNGPLPDTVRSEGRSRPLEELLAESDILLALTEYSATAPLMAWGRKLGHLRGASMPGVTKQMEKTALAADYAQVNRKCQVLARRLREAEKAVVTFSTGHQVVMDLRYREPHADGGHCPLGADPPFINLPSGEAYQALYEGERPDEPSWTQGEIPVQRGEELFVLQVENNRIAQVLGKGPHADKMRAYLAVDLARRNVAEIGLGCNDKAVLSGHLVEDEKAGFHWAFGRSEHLGGTVGPEAFSDPAHVVHQDLVYAVGCPVIVARLELCFPNGSAEEIMRDGRYTLF